MVLRNCYRLMMMPEVQKLSHPARWWLYGLAMAWTGHNNGVIEFTRRRHAAQYGLSHPEVFEKARRDVLASGLVTMTYQGGHSVPAQYALASLPLQAPPRTSQVGTPPVPSNAEIVGTSPVPSDAKTGTSPVPTRYVSRTNKSASHIKIARASEYRKLISNPTAVSLTEHSAHSPANEEGPQGEDIGRPQQANGTTPWRPS
jgi:hypothetical protein